MNRLTSRWKTLVIAALGLAVCAAQSSLAEVATENLVNPDDTSDIWGQKITGLGDNGDEVALVFTKTGTTMSWTLPNGVGSIWYLVVGGGGSGGTSYADANSGGGGGGAGGMIESKDVTLTSRVLSVQVGAGGAAVTATGNTAAARPAGNTGGNSTLTVNGNAIVAHGGGGGGGCGSSAGKKGGSGGGAYAYGTVGACYEDEGNVGGQGTSKTYGGGGGGGAGSAGGSTSTAAGGAGGDGKTSEIGGGYVSLVKSEGKDIYCAGGGGGAGSTKNGGAGGLGGGGKGNSYAATATTSGSGTNYGCGGGGTQGNQWKKHTSGAGYQGVVIVRYQGLAANVIEVPTLASKVYTGETLVADVSASNGYTVTANAGGSDVGDYVVTLTLNAGYTWDDGTTEAKSLTFTITQAQNEWTAEPAISKTTWLASDEPGVLTAGATMFGAVSATIAKDGGEAEAFDGTLPTTAGDYVVTYTAPATCANYLAPAATVKSISFTIVSDSEVPPFTVAFDGAISVGEAQGALTATLPYCVACDVVSSKTVTIYALYVESGSTVTNELALAENVTLDGAGSGRVGDLKPNATYLMALYGQGGERVSSTSNWVTVTMPGAAQELTAAATFTNEPQEFILSGSVTPGLGTTTVYLRWSLNSDALDQSATYTFAYGDNGTFTTNIAYTALTDTLTWDVAVSTVYTSTTYGEQQWSASLTTSTTTREDTAAVTYTWTGAGEDNSWTNAANWSANVTPCFGIPNSESYATAKFTQAAAVNLGEAAIKLVKNGLQFADNIEGEVLISNGTIKAEYKVDKERGAAGTTVVYSDLAFTAARFGPIDGSTLVFAGNSSLSGCIRPWGVTNQKLVFRDGEIEIGYFAGYCNYSNNGNDLLISNAVVTTTVKDSGGDRISGRPYRFIDGVDREARLVVTQNAFALTYSYEVTLPERGRTLPVIQAPTCKDDSSSYAFKLEVTDWKRGTKIPLVKFTGADQTEIMAKKTGTLTAYANGVDVTEKRNASLEWSATDNTLYYVQDCLTGLLILLR